MSPQTGTRAPQLYRLPDVRRVRSLLERVRSLLQENDTLRANLDRCYQRLRALPSIGDELLSGRASAGLFPLFVRRFATLLRADAVLVHAASEITALFPTASAEPLHVDVDIRRAYDRAADAAALRGAAVAFCLPSAHAGGAACFGMAAPLPAADGRRQVLVALREDDALPFAADELVTADVLAAFGGQLLCNVSMVEQVERSAFETVCALARVIEARDHYTGGHSERVGRLARRIGMQLGLADETCRCLEWAGMLHDVGKMGVAEEILNKRGALTPEEMQQVQRHPQLSYDMLRPVRSLAGTLDAVLYHHENLDGSGYPYGLSGNQIPLSARIMRVADAFDALTTTRAYRAARSVDWALQELQRGAGVAFDAEVVDALAAVLRSDAPPAAQDAPQTAARPAPPRACAAEPSHRGRTDPAHAAVLSFAPAAAQRDALSQLYAPRRTV